MQSSKIDFLTKYNNLVSAAIKGTPEFADNLSEFLVAEYELQGTIIFKIGESNKLSVLGKSSEAKKSFTKEVTYSCDTCEVLKSGTSRITFNTSSGCQIQTTDFVQHEGCVYLYISESERFLVKLAKKTPFSKTDKDNLELIGEALSNLLKLWTGNKGDKVTTTAEIVTSIAHELRTPTNSIMGFASLLNEDNLTASQKEYVATLKDSAYNLLALINDLVDIAKIDSGTTKNSLTLVNVKNIVDEVVSSFSDKIDKDKIDFIVNYDKDLPSSLKLDAGKIKFILGNIITYALRMTEKGKISILVAPVGPHKINFKVSDTSIGLSSNKLKEIFTPFSLSDLGNSKIGTSTGLGLTLAKKYIELQNGVIEVTSSVGKGTIYNFVIGTEPISVIEDRINALPKPAANKNKVLVVEDDYATSKLLSNYLHKWGYEPTIVNSGEQALKAVDSDVYLSILMDIVLPDGNGFELLKKFREHKNSKNTPVIVCSIEAEQQKAFLMGAVEYFVKPIKYKYLVEVLTSYKLKKDSNILIVDDDVPTLNLVKEAVEQAGYNAIAESHSSKVMNLIEAMNLDLAIIDLDMPELNGFDLIKQIKSKSNFSKLPIIIYTGKENYQEDLKKINGMFTELLQKNSTNIEELSDTINQMINRYDDPPPKEEVEKQKDTIKILLVEDYKHSQIIVTRLLKKNNFESIVVVENGAEAVDEVKKQKFDLVLMDMQMPVMNGFEATEKIRQLPEYKETPIIALTAFAMKGDREKCLEAGATDYIPKPIDSQEFIEKVKYYTESKVDA